MRRLRRYGTLIGFAGIVAAFTVLLPDTFLTARNLLNISQQVSMLAVVAFSMTLVMAMGDFDLSVGSMASLAGVTAAAMFQAGHPVAAGVGAALAVGLAGGLLNGVLVAWVGILPFVATLGTLTMFSGAAFVVSDGRTIFGRDIPESFAAFARGGVEVAGVTLPAQASSFYLVAVLLAAAVWAAQRVHASPLGLVWNALREDEVATRCLGVDVTRAKLWAMGFGTLLGGLAGGLYAHTVGFVAPDNFTFLHSVMLVSMVILGGADRAAGAVVGAVLLTVVPEKFRAFHDYRLLLYGAVLLAMLHVRPQGLLPRAVRTYASVSELPAAPRAERPVEAGTVAVR